MRGPARVPAPQAPAKRQTGALPERSAPLLRLQRSIGNRAIGSALRRTSDATPGSRALARDPAPNAVDDAQLGGEQKRREVLRSFAQACLNLPNPFREGMVGQLVAQLVLVYLPDSVADVTQTGYDPGQTGIGATATGRAVIGDEALKRIAGGDVDQVGAELRGAALQLAAIEFSAHKPAIVWIAGERVRVHSAQEATDAQRIVTLLRDTYGVAFDSVATRRAARQDKAERGASVESLRASDVAPWTMLDLRDLEEAFRFYAPVLGRARGSSGRASSPQEVVRVGRLSSDARHGSGDKSEEGEYLTDAHTIALYQSQPEVVSDPDASTLVHEIAHAVFGPLRPRFVKEIGYWEGQSEHRGDGTLEAPPTRYGTKDPDEDLAESVMLFFTAPDSLKGGIRGKHRGEWGNPCPKRHAWIKKEVAQWSAAKSH